MPQASRSRSRRSSDRAARRRGRSAPSSRSAATGSSARSRAAASRPTSPSSRRRSLEAGAPQLVSYGIADEEAWKVGLPCGGEIDVFVEPFTGAPPVERGTSYVVVAGEGVGERWHGDADGKTGLREEDGRTVFAERVSPPPRLVIVGAGDIAEAICALARPLGWHTQVVEPRVGPRDARAGAERRRAGRGLARRDRGRREHRPSSRSSTRSGSTCRRCRPGSRAGRSMSARSARAARRRSAALRSATRSPTGARPGGAEARRRDAGRDRARDRRRDPGGHEVRARPV